jgi:hypothetical protein
MPSPFDGTPRGPRYRGSPPPTGRRLSIISNRPRGCFHHPPREVAEARLRLWPPGKSGSKASGPPLSRIIPLSRKICDCPLSDLGPLLRGRHPRRRSVVSARRAGNRSPGALTCAKLGAFCAGTCSPSHRVNDGKTWPRTSARGLFMRHQKRSAGYRSGRLNDRAGRLLDLARNNRAAASLVLE